MDGKTYAPLGPNVLELYAIKNKVAHITRKPYTGKVRIEFTGKVFFQKFEIRMPDGTLDLINIEEALT